MLVQRSQSQWFAIAVSIVIFTLFYFLFAAPAQAQINNPLDIIPIGPGCIGSSPPGSAAPVCCINGKVFLNGEPVSGAAVTIQSSTGSLQVFTQRHTGDDEQPAYQAPLSMAPISATTGSVITISVQYAGLRKSVQHIVQEGRQTIDLTLNPTGLSISPGLVEQPTPGRFNDPRDVAVSSRGNIYVVDQGNLRVQVYQPDGTLLNFPKWQKRFGNEPGQWSSNIGGIAIDPRTDTVYLADSDNQRIARYNTEGNLMGLWTGSQTADQTNFFPSDVAVDGAGYVYALVYAVLNNNNESPYRLYKFDPQHDTAVRWGQSGQTYVIFGKPNQLTVSANGEVYVSDSGHNQVYHFDAAGQHQPFTITFAPTLSNSPPISNPIGIALDSSDTLYLADFYSVGNGKRARILAISSDGHAHKAWNYPTFNETGLDNPYGMALGGNILYLVDSPRDKNRVARLDVTADILAPWGGTDTGTKQLAGPTGVTVGPAGTPFAGQLFVADCDSKRIAVIQETTIVQIWSYTNAGSTDPNWCPWQLAFDNQNRLLIFDSRNQTSFLRRYQINGNQLMEDGGPWTGEMGNTSRFSGLIDFAVDRQNRLYLADDQNRRVVIYAIQDNQTLTPIATFSGVTATGILTAPQGIAINDSDINNVQIYLSDTGNNRLLKLNFNGSSINYGATWGNESNLLTCPNSGTTKLNKPKGLLVAPDGHLYVADQNFHRVLKLTQNGACVQILGQGVGRAEPGKLDTPEDVVMDAQGMLYVSNRNYSGIARFAPPQSTLPLATITHVSNNAIALQEDNTLEIIGQGQASLITETITAFLWSSSLDGALNAKNKSAISSTLRISATDLQPGLHQITLVVTDHKGRQSPPATAQVRRVPKVADFGDGQCNGETWTFMLYLVGDFTDGGALRNLYDQELARLNQNRNPCVQVAIQIDGPADAPMPSNLTQIANIRPGAPMVVGQLDEVKMDEGAALQEFVLAAQKMAPTQHYYLAIANHGQGIRGIGWDKSSGDDAFLTPREIADALADPRIVPIDILHLDACSMGLLDVAYELRHSARRLIASQYIGWSFFAYSAYIRHVQTAQATNAEGLSSAILAEYARLGDQERVPYTLSSLNPARAEVVQRGLSALSAALIGWSRQNQQAANVLRTLRQNLKTLDSNGDLRNEKLTDAYVDLQDLLQAIVASTTITDPLSKGLAQQLLAELTDLALDQRLVVGHRFASWPLYGFYGGYFIQADIDLDHTHGISVYFPPETLAPAHQAQAAGGAGYSTAYHDYLQIETPYQDFTRDTRWEDLLYTLLGAPPTGETLVDVTPPLAPVAPSTRLFLPLIRR